MERAHDRHEHLNRSQNHERRRRKFAPFLFYEEASGQSRRWFG
jgi:hypothetical protein